MIKLALIGVGGLAGAVWYFHGEQLWTHLAIHAGWM
jgi:hypothetical protein